MATKDKLVTVEGLTEAYNSLRVPSVEIQITTGQWSGSGPYTFTANVSNVTSSTFINAQVDSSISYLQSDLTVTTGTGTVTFSTASLPTGTVNVTVYFPGIQGDVETQVLSDVYSTSQTYSKSEAVAKADIVNNLTTTATTEGKVLDARQGKALSDAIAQSTASFTNDHSYAQMTTPTLTNGSHYGNYGTKYIKIGCFLYIIISAVFDSAPTNALLFTLPTGYRPLGYTEISVSGGGSYNAKAQCSIRPDGNVYVTSVDKWVTGGGMFVVTAV